MLNTPEVTFAAPDAAAEGAFVKKPTRQRGRACWLPLADAHKKFVSFFSFKEMKEKKETNVARISAGGSIQEEGLEEEGLGRRKTKPFSSTNSALLAVCFVR